MPKYLIDVNLPYYFGLWNSEEYVHQIDIDAAMKDKEIWDYAKEHELTIITKDSDFSNRIMFKEPPPKVIHIRFGNMSMKEFHKTVKEAWVGVIEMNKDYKLVNVYKDKIEGIK
ncbi:DUF5615 family PIN-like protein [Phaeodactylibacter luteus]|uniref:DUF5615 domain-containing protein n=1 Tax=Phaeodactylibacter luteus TaxID=1564516 RepID=A0A5C6RJS8_9BACT|nr:DUF5615 family PIN-like protein [Phaeodactylibacter luteus]TXB62676.1 hypothetical protein FRY97_13120 [Phaeodactylibacter luteus]